MDKLADTNRTRMEHLSLSVITIGSKYLTRSITRLGKSSSCMLTKQARPLIDGGALIGNSPLGVRKVVTK